MALKVSDHVWTEKEKEWKERLVGDKVYEMLTLGEAYETAPECEAFDKQREQYGDWWGDIWCKWEMLIPPIAEGLVMLIHAPANCPSVMRSFHSQLAYIWGFPFHHMTTTGMDKRQIVFGGENELYEAIKAVDRDYHPELIVVNNGCAASLIQDDIIRVVETAQQEVGAKLFFIPTAGYELTPLGQVIEQNSASWTGLMEPPRKVDKDAVNILGRGEYDYFPDKPRRYPTSADELARYIVGLGLKVHWVMGQGSLEDLRRAPEAGVNTIECGTWGFPIAFIMKEKYGTPYVYNELPLGVESISAWIRELASLTGREEEAEKLIKKEYEAIKDVYERCKEMVAGKTVILGGIGNRAMSYLRFCKELGMETIFIPFHPEIGRCVDHEIKAKKVDNEYFLSSGWNPLVLRVHPGIERTTAQYRLPVLMDKLGLSKEDIIYMYLDYAPYDRAGTLDPSDIPYHYSPTQTLKRWGFPGRAVGFRGVEGWCLGLMEAVKAAKRKTAPTFYGRIYGQSFEF